MTTPRVTVPVEPTDEMIEAAKHHWPLGYTENAKREDTVNLYRAMLSAAPAPEGGAVSSALREMLALVLLKYGNTDEAVNAAVERAQAALATREVASADHHDRNLSMTNDELIEQALSHPPLEAPAEVGEEFATAEAMAEAWSDRIEIQRMVETTSAVFARWASPDLLSRFRQQMMGVIQQAYIEGVGARVEALRAQPPAREDAQPVAWRVTNRATGHEQLFWKPPADLPFNRERFSTEPLYTHPAPDALRVANLWWNAEDWEQTFNSLEDAYDAATGGEMRGVAKLGRATEHDPVWALRIDFDTTGDGETDDYEIRLFATSKEAHAYLAALQAEQGAK